MIPLASRSSRRSTLNLLKRRLPRVSATILRRTLHVSSSLLQRNDPSKFDKHMKSFGSKFMLNIVPNPLSENNNIIHVAERPFDLGYLNRQKIIYDFMLYEFVQRCQAAEAKRAKGDIAMFPNSINITLDEIKMNFIKEYPNVKELSDDEILNMVRIYYSISNQIIPLNDFRFDNTDVQKLFEIHLEDIGADAAEVAKLAKLDEKAVSEWIEIFKLLESVPFAIDSIMTFPLCPAEYRVLQGLKKFQKTDSSSSSHQTDSQDPFGSFFNNRGKSSDDKSNSKKKTIKEINFELSPKLILQYTIFFTLLTLFLTTTGSDNSNEITFQNFVTDYLTKNRVKKVTVVNNSYVEIELNDHGVHQGGQPQTKLYFTIGSVGSFEKNLRDAQDKYDIPPQLRVPVNYTTKGNMARVLINFLPTVLFLGAIYWMTKKAASSMGGMGPMGFGKSTAKKFNQETEVKTKFKDVAGMEEAKLEVMEFVKFLQNPEKYEKLGAKIPRGAILSGPPGTGKTLLAKATAGEAGVPFYSVSGSEFVEMFVGVGASRVRDLFKTARENAPSIVFVDEIDAIGKQRSKGNATGANDERETTLNQLLVEMDGFDTSDHVVVLAGTNRPDILDKALMRPGRFDRHVHIDNPELQGRKEIFEVHLKKITLQENIDSDIAGRLAALTPGFSGADIANVCNEAALIAARYNAESVGLRHFELAIERVIGGVEKKSKLLNPEEQKIVAYHEAGHAICGWFLRYAHPLLKVSIIPRGQGALGYAQYLPPDQYLMSALQLYDRMIMTLGGRVSEELHFASVTSGAHDDFKKVTGIAQSMVLRFGMSKKVGMVNYYDTKSQDDLTKPFSEETSRVIDEEVQRIVNDCYQKCKQLLTEKSHEVELVAQELLKKEFITREDMIRLLGKRPFPETNDAFDKYLDGKPAFASESQKYEEEQKKKQEDSEKENKD